MIYRHNACDPSNAQIRAKNILRSVKEQKWLSLYIEPASVCNLSCCFCDFHNKNIDFEKQKGIMTFEAYENILREVASLPFVFETVNFYLHGEPLLNKNLHKMISMAASKGIGNKYTIATNGILLTPNTFENLASAGLNDFYISLDTTIKDNYKFFKGKNTLDTVLQNINSAIDIIRSKDLEINFNIKVSRSQSIYGIQEEDEQSVIDTFHDVAIESNRIHVMIDNEFEWYSGGKEKFTTKDNTPCEAPFFQVAINYDGEVTVCCLDITYSLRIGNIGKNKNSLYEIIKGERLNNIRKILLSGNLDRLVSCQYCGMRTVWDFDSIKEELLSYLQSN